MNDHKNATYTESLARALVLSGREAEAQQLLLQLRESTPENPQINLELARLSARKAKLEEAIRYYHNALYGIWKGEDIDQRQRDVRIELINFLIAQHAHERALPEILALAYHVPNDAPAHLQLADMFARVGDLQRARSEFGWVLGRDPDNQAALAGAGNASFQLRDYSHAREMLHHLQSRTPAEKESLDTATLVTNNDPLEPHLSYKERGQRLLNDFDRANQTLQGCLARGSDGDTEALSTIRDRFSDLNQSLRASTTRSLTDLVFPALDLIGQAEIEISKSCAPVSPFDRALLLIAQKSRSEQ